MRDATCWLADHATAREAAGLRRRLSQNSSRAGILDLASNDYLGLARNTQVAGAAASAARRWGAGATGSRLVTGSTDLHRDLEQDLAAHAGAETALVFSSGYMANLGAISALAGSDCLIVSDDLNHASIIDACRLARSRVVVARHGDYHGMGRVLSERSERRAVLVSDAVFSVDGDIADVAALHGVARSNGALLVVDEAHSFGVVGIRGEGACGAAGIADEPDVVISLTLSKSLGAQGGAVAASAEVVAHLVDSARSFIFDTALAPPAAAAAREALRILRAEPQRPAAARSRAKDLARAARGAGWRPTDPQAAVMSIPLASPEKAVLAADICMDRGVHVGCFRPPSVPDRVSRMRLTSRATLSDADIDRARDALESAARGLGAA